MLSLIKRFGAPFGRGAKAEAASPITSSVVAPPTVTWPEAGVKPALVAMRCPNCGSRARKPLQLTVNFATPDHPMRHSRVLRCPDCTCLFYEDQNPPDYTEESMLGRGRVTFYLQQGAGVSLITRPLAQVRKPAGSTYLEVGCGFGFGLDFALRTKGWTGTGIDPGQISALGRDLLDVPIELRYLGDDEPEYLATCDVVMASETIEHVPSPIAFVRTLKRALKPGGILILTTPNAAELTADKAQGMLVPLLSPGLHLVFQNNASLKQLLEKAGFEQIMMGTDGVSLVAFASETPFKLEADEAKLREIYRDHLEQRAKQCPPESDLFYAFAGRALQESVNDADLERAGRAMDVLRAACRVRFGFDTETIADLPAEAATCSLERLAELMPLNLGGVLYSDAIRRLTEGTPRAELRTRFACAAAAADAMRRALGELAMEDGMSEDISWTATSEAMLCAGVAGHADVIELALAIGAPPGGDPGAWRRGAVIERGLAALVNAGHYELAHAYALATGLQQADWANPTPPAVATGPARPAHPDDPTPEPVKQPPLSATRRDALFCLAIMDAQPPAPETPPETALATLERALRRFGRIREAVGPPEPPGSLGDLFWQAIRGEFQAIELMRDPSRLDSALAEYGALFATLETPVPKAIRELDARLKGERVVALVNAGDYTHAAAIAATLAAPSGGERPFSPLERDVTFCLAVLDVQPPTPDYFRAQQRFGDVRHSLVPGGAVAAHDGEPLPGLYWAALRGELQALAMSAGWEAAEARRASVLAVLGANDAEIPPDLLARMEPPPQPATAPSSDASSATGSDPDSDAAG